ncbi:hypothetical protein HDU88_003614 [Geranomyces variabilis]|nr:hypothetical protein HDU88_003614 [Geranomyces variabilis]
MSNDTGIAVSAPAQLRLLLEVHASVLRLENISDSDLHLDFREPLTPTELPAFTWLSIVYLCSKQRSWQPAHDERDKLPLPVWQWIEELAYLSAQQGNEDAALNVFAELRNVCLTWIAPVGLRRAASIWKAVFQRHYYDVNESVSDERLRNTWFVVRGPAVKDFQYKDEVRLELDPILLIPGTDDWHAKLPTFSPIPTIAAGLQTRGSYLSNETRRECVV